MQTYCLLSKDQWAGKPINLLPWQHDFIDRFFGTGHYQGDYFRRHYTHSRIFAPKKAAKSPLMAGLAIHFALEKRGNEVLIIASNIKQARIIYDECAYMVTAHPALKSIFWTRDHLSLIKCKRNNSVIKVLSSNPAGVSGWNGDVICDEIAEWAPSTCGQVWAKLQNAGAARRNAALLTISHANFHQGEHVGWQQWLWANEVLKDPSKDPHLLPIIYAADPAKWEDPDEWARVSPGWGTIIDPEEFKADYLRAKQNPRDLNRFKTFRLNIWCSAAESYIGEELYNPAVTSFDEADFYGDTAFAGLDISRQHDLTALFWLFERDGKLYLLPRIITPEDTLAKKSKTDKVPYERWVQEGHVLTCPGDQISHDYLMDLIREDGRKFRVDRIRYDPWNANMLATALAKEGFVMEEYPCNRPNSMLAPTGELERQFLKGAVRVPDNPCVRWCFQNAVIERKGADGIFVNKSKCPSRVDAVMASILAVSGWMASKDGPGLADASWVRV